MSVRQNITVFRCTKDLSEVKAPLIECIAARIPHSEWHYGIDIDKKDKMVIFSGDFAFRSRSSEYVLMGTLSAAETMPHLNGLEDEWKDRIAAPPLNLSLGLNRPLEDILRAPIVEPVFFFFSNADPKWAKSIERSDQVTKYTAKGYIGSAWGWAADGVHHTSLGQAEGRCFVVISGWESVEAHEAFRKTDEFKNARGRARGLIKAVEWFHIHVDKAV
ncbi:hypothetical protein BJ166DRAFT_597882 [Pestalotiopsis sp. NC0098]|nr:hypothetical protein BJ166DRAFT_597882 [Pestalotiopsis sp. NC0098]